MYSKYSKDGKVQNLRKKGQKFLHCPVAIQRNNRTSSKSCRDGLGKPINIPDRTQDGTVQDFDSCPVPSHWTKRTEQKRMF